MAGIALALHTGISHSAGDYRSDLDQVWYGSRALLSGADPYRAVGPGMSFDYGFPLYYPLPTLIAFTPLALLPLAVARSVFVAVSAALLAYAVTREAWHRLFILLSGAFLASLAIAQWAPLMAAAFLLPWLGSVIVLKPNLGLAVAAASPDRRILRFGAVTGALLLLVSFLIDPTWLGEWLTFIWAAPHFTPPVMHWGGAFVLLALLRWRRPEARLLVAMACVPQTTLPYEGLLVLLVASTWWESLLLGGLSLATLVCQRLLDTRIPLSDPGAIGVFTEWANTMGIVMVVLLYLPATLLVLRRPNEGPLPAWVSVIESWRVRGRTRGLVAD